MEGIGAEVSEKIRSAIKAKLSEIGVYVDKELPDYVMIMVINKRSKDEMDEELQLFLGKHTSLFTTWLHQVLQKLQEVTVGNKGATKRKLSDDTKKKKKSKTGVEKKDNKKKIKIEHEEDGKKEELGKGGNKERKDSSVDKDCESRASAQLVESTKIDRPILLGQTKEASTSKSSKQVKDNRSLDTHLKSQDQSAAGKSASSLNDDLDDDDCINIRTDGELLDTNEEVNAEEISKKTKESDDLTSLKSNEKDSEKRRISQHSSPARQKPKSKSEDRDNQTKQNKKVSKRESTPVLSSPDDKVMDARELLNRKKAAKQSDSRARTRSRDRSSSPPHKRRMDDRGYRDDRDSNRKSARDDDRELYNRRTLREDERDRRSTRDRDYHTLKRRDDDRSSRRTEMDRINSRDSRRRDSSNEPLLKRVTLEKTYRNKRDWDSVNSSKLDNESPTKKSDLEESRKRSGLVSRVVSRAQQSDDDMETPVTSVVKVTPRPRRPPSQQASSTLIMKAISEANRSLANVPPRPDSTQRSRKEPVFTRTLRTLERIPPEKIAVSITNPLAHQNIEEETHDINSPTSTKEEDTISNQLSSHPQAEVSSSEPVHSAQNENITIECKEDNIQEQSQLEDQEPVLQLEPEAELVEAYDEPIDETSSNTQFVVTLNGYDPDGLYSQSELDIGDDGECDDWLKEHTDDEPILTSTPDEAHPPGSNRVNPSSPNVIMNNIPTVNHSNLIEVEIVKPKPPERCKFWPACRLADKCTYYHPTKPCMVFPNCKFGDACLYIHPQCKYNALCTRKDCVFAHSPAHTPFQTPIVPKPKALYAASAVLQCKFYPNCTNINCQFAHPSWACRFGFNCTKKDCVFHHQGQVAPVEKLKWTRVPTTI